MRFIYKIISPNGKIYIGQTNNINRRIGQYKHLWCDKQPKLYNSLKKYGWNNFTLKILEYIPDILADDYEQYYIKKFDCINSGLNHDSGGHFGKKHSIETRKKMSESGKKKIFTEKHRGNLREAKLKFWKDKDKNSQQQKCIKAIVDSVRKQNPMLGKKHSEKTKKLIRHKASLQKRDAQGKYI